MTIREQIINYVTMNPGCSATEMGKALGLPQVNVSTTAGYLARADKLSRRREHGLRYPNVGYWVYFPFGH